MKHRFEITGNVLQKGQRQAKKNRTDVRTSYSWRILISFSKNRPINAIISLVFYYGSEPWDGPVDLYDMFRLEGTEKEKQFLKNIFQIIGLIW